jgi:peptidyl-dipeptidase Dcp
MIPFLQYADNRDLREKLYNGYFMRGNNNDEFDNKEIFMNIAKLRVERANLLGFDNYAEYVISQNMAQTPQKVYDFLNELLEPAMKIAKRDRNEMQKIIDSENGNFKLDSWDWWYYTEKLRKQKFDLEESELQPYFSLEKVRDGMFYVATKLYGITFTKLPNMPVYHPEVEVFEVKEANGDHVAVLYLDYHPRDGKRVGAWCGRLRGQDYIDGKKIHPIVTITTNFTRPNGDIPALLTWDEVTTLFHEFGHALHGFFTDGEYSRIAGSLQRDMVELPSQVMEHWASQPEVLKVYAKHYETGEVIPQELMDKLAATSIFNEAFQTVEYAAAAFLDLEWHTLSESKDVDVLAFEKESMEKINLIPEILPRYRTTYFSHVVGGYVAGYYVYYWAAVLDTDAFQYFYDSGDIYNNEIAAKFRKHVLSEGGNDEGMVQYKKFRGQEPSIEPLLKLKGFK